MLQCSTASLLVFGGEFLLAEMFYFLFIVASC